MRLKYACKSSICIFLHFFEKNEKSLVRCLESRLKPRSTRHQRVIALAKDETIFLRRCRSLFLEVTLTGVSARVGALLDDRQPLEIFLFLELLAVC